MSTVLDAPVETPEIVTSKLGDVTRPLWAQRMRSVDHKQIGILMITFALIAISVAGTGDLMTWLQRLVPDSTLLTPERFNRLITLHDTTLLFFCAFPLLMGLMTYAVPLSIGARNTALPRLNALSLWLMVFGGITLWLSLFINVPEFGLTAAAPLTSKFYSPGAGVDFWLVAVILAGSGITLNAIDLFVTIANGRAPGMTYDKLPLFAIATKVYSVGALIVAPVLIGAALLLLIERQSDLIAVFDPSRGGSPLLWEGLYAVFTNAAPLLLTIAAIGVVSEIVPVFSGRVIAARSAVAKALVAIGAIAVLGFSQKLYSAPIDGAWTVVGAVIGIALIVPVAVIVRALLASIGSGSTRFEAPMLYAYGYIVTLVLATIGLVMLAIPTVGQLLGGSQFAQAVFLTAVAGAAFLGAFAGLHFWIPKMTGRLLNDTLSKLSFWMIFAGAVVLVLSMASLGLDGMPKDVYEYPSGSGLQVRNVEGVIGTVVIAIGFFIALINFIRAAASGPLAGNDPWHGDTLEWFAPSPPPPHNFDVLPAITSATPAADLRRQVASASGALAGSVAQPPTGGRPSLRETHPS